MKMSKTLVSLVVMGVMFMDIARAANYTVGAPNGGWDQATDLTTWSSSLSFMEGDNLVFQYTINHDVTEVSKSDFDSCTASSPLQPPLTGGAAVVPLTSAGSRYFICGTGGHCIGGMKLQVTTLAASTPPPSTTPTVPSPPPSTTPDVPSSPPPSTTPDVPSSPPSTTPDVPSPPPAKRPVSSPPSKTMAPSPSASSAPPPSGSSLPIPPPAPSSAAKFDVMGALTGLVLMIFVINA